MLLLQNQPSNGGMTSMLLMVGLIIIMMFLMTRSQRKQAKKEAEFRKNMKKGDPIIFSGGIHGRVHEVGETTVDVEVGNATILTVEKSMVQPVQEKNTKK